MSDAAPKTTLRIDFPNGIRLGPGKADLLERVGEQGSISAAGAAMGMSYRRAWMLIDEINRMFREPSVVTRHGGKAGGGAELTPFGQDLVRRYRRMEADLRAAISEDLDYLSDALSPATDDT